MHFRYVDGTFVIFQNKKESEEFLIRLNGLLLRRKGTTPLHFSTSPRNTRRSATKPKFTANLRSLASTSTLGILYPVKCKISLVSTLVHRALKICYKRKLKEETKEIVLDNRIKEILLDNEYPEEFVLTQIPNKITQFHAPNGLDLTSVQSTYRSSTLEKRH